jgi:hypothetical protein
VRPGKTALLPGRFDIKAMDGFDIKLVLKVKSGQEKVQLYAENDRSGMGKGRQTCGAKKTKAAGPLFTARRLV